MRVSWIEDGFLAASPIPLSEQDIRSLYAQGIRAILTLTEQPLTALREISPRLLESLEIVNLHVPIADEHPPQIEQVPQIIGFLEAMRAQQRPTLIHCHAGIGRTGTVLHLYLLSQGLNLDETRARIRARRSYCVLLTEAQHKFVNEYANRATSSP